MKAKHSCAYMTEACEIHCGKLIKSLSRNAPTLRKSGGAARCVTVAAEILLVSLNTRSSNIFKTSVVSSLRLSPRSYFNQELSVKLWHDRFKRGTLGRRHHVSTSGRPRVSLLRRQTERGRNTCGCWRPRQVLGLSKSQPCGRGGKADTPRQDRI